MTTVSGAPSSSSTRSTSACASRSWMTSGLPDRLAIAMCARKLVSCAARPRRRCGTCPARSRRCRVPAGAAASASISRSASSRSATSRGASFGCSATVASTAGCAVGQRRRPTATTARRQPTWTSRSTPTARGRLDRRRRVAADDVEVGVAVQHRHGQRLGRRWGLGVAAAVGAGGPLGFDLRRRGLRHRRQGSHEPLDVGPHPGPGLRPGPPDASVNDTPGSCDLARSNRPNDH